MEHVRNSTKWTLLLLVFVIVSCREYKGHSDYDKNLSFNKFKDEVSSLVFAEFPIKTKKEVKSSYIQVVKYPASFEYLKYCGVFIAYKYDSITYQNFINLLEQRKKVKYNLNDSCNVFMPLRDIGENKCIKKHIPIPNLLDNSIGLDSLISKDNSICYIFNSGTGKFLKNEQYYTMIGQNSKGQLLIKNGFSNGAVADSINNVIVYYISVW